MRRIVDPIALPSAGLDAEYCHQNRDNAGRQRMQVTAHVPLETGQQKSSQTRPSHYTTRHGSIQLLGSRITATPVQSAIFHSAKKLLRLYLGL